MCDLSTISTLNKFNHKNTRFNSFISNIIFVRDYSIEGLTYIISFFLITNISFVFFSWVQIPDWMYVYSICSNSKLVTQQTCSNQIFFYKNKIKNFKLTLKSIKSK